jgi:hypothetical protein
LFEEVALDLVGGRGLVGMLVQRLEQALEVLERIVYHSGLVVRHGSDPVGGSVSPQHYW